VCVCICMCVSKGAVGEKHSAYALPFIVETCYKNT
jgi:hypothetical protein